MWRGGRVVDRRSGLFDEGIWEDIRHSNHCSGLISRVD